MDLATAATQLDAAPHGTRTALAARLAAELGMSVAGLYAAVAKLRAPRKRKPSAARGRTTLTVDEARLIHAAVVATVRETGTGALPLMECVSVLRAAGRINAGTVNPETGEWKPLSESAIRRAMRTHGYHADLVAATTQAVSLASAHPNHVWQIDASVSRQFFLADDGAQVMARREYYRGKPGNFAAINSRRIWRYVIADHCTGALELFYVQGAESAGNVVASLIHALTQRDAGTMYGVPRMIMLDVGSGNTAAPVRNLCAALGIELHYTKPGNPRAKGSVEKGQDLVERLFEAQLKLRAPVTSIDEINRLAQDWVRRFNCERIHSRHRMTRREAWLRITREQLVLAPPVATLRALANSNPVAAKARDGYIRAFGSRWDVRGLPGLINGQTLQVVRNALDDESVRVLVDRDGEPGAYDHYIAPRVGVDEWGQLTTAVPIGEYAALAQTPAEARAVEIDKLITGEETREAREAARKARRVPFGGSIDPFKQPAPAPVPAIPRAATPSAIAAPAEIAPDAPPVRPTRIYTPAAVTGLALVRAIKAAVEARGGQWNGEWFDEIGLRWPDGVDEEQIDSCAVALMRPRLAAIGGGNPA